MSSRPVGCGTAPLSPPISSGGGRTVQGSASPSSGRGGTIWLPSRPLDRVEATLTPASDTSPNRNDPARKNSPPAPEAALSLKITGENRRTLVGRIPLLVSDRGPPLFRPGAPLPTGSLHPKPVVAESLLDRMIPTIHTVPTNVTAGPRRPRPWTRARPEDRRVDTWVLTRARGLSGCSS